ncbi:MULTISPECIES: hypothetical protein [Acetobacter]|uniref:Lipoprotein n=4 Tax=Acetobacter TaxID=434 RepID=A0ABT1ESV6_9PROT|nr:hypothetical protein [Acetobacter cerevisiae]MCP1246252.1 hypothetical protein [Acetobacter cerevisiae]MCP1255803.1 hypothetical protein [Acetobacter cerevisiae]
MISRLRIGLVVLSLSIAGCASHKEKTAETTCQNTAPAHHRAFHGRIEVGNAMQTMLPAALGAIPGAGNMAGGLAGMGMRQAMNGFGPHPHQPPPEKTDQEEQPEATRPSFPCQPEKDVVPDLKADDIKMEEAR